MYSTSKLGNFSDHVEIAVTYCYVTFSLFFYRNDRIKIKTDTVSEDIKVLWSYMCRLVEILHVLQDEIGLVCWQLLHEIRAMEIF